MPITMDDKVLAREHSILMLLALRDIVDAHTHLQRTPSGRKREAAITRLVIQASNAATLLSQLNLNESA